MSTEVKVYFGAHIYERALGLYETKDEAIEQAWRNDEENVFELVPKSDLDAVVRERDGAIAHAEVMEHKASRLSSIARAQDATITRLREALCSLLDIIHESKGVYGYHLNGEPSPWSDFRESIDMAGETLAGETKEGE